MFQLSQKFKNSFPEAHTGFLTVTEFSTPAKDPVLSDIKQKLMEDIRKKYHGCERKDLKKIPEIQAYTRYYKRFRKTYHVLLQLESVALKNRGIPSGNPLLQIMFMAELNNLLLTSIHDLNLVNMPVIVDRADGTEKYQRIDQNIQELKKEDMYMKDKAGIISSVIYGPDFRTKIMQETTSALFTVYAPEGIDKRTTLLHLRDIRSMIRESSPSARAGDPEILTATGPVDIQAL